MTAIRTQSLKLALRSWVDVCEDAAKDAPGGSTAQQVWLERKREAEAAYVAISREAAAQTVYTFWIVPAEEDGA